MTETAAMTIPGGIIDTLKQLVREAVHDELTEQLAGREQGFLDVERAGDFLATSSAAIRALVKRHAIPFHKAPNGRLLFERDELRFWATSNSARGT